MSFESSTSRDLRLDFFRGLALVCIFIDHVPGNRLTNYTIRNLGFSDASEVFVFISAYAAGLVYGGRFARDGFLAAARRVWTRAGVVYLAHLLLVVATSALAARLSALLGDPQFINGLNVQPMLAEPWPTFLRTLVLGFQPVFNNILPLYFVLLLWVPAMLWVARWNVLIGLAGSFALWALAKAGLHGTLDTLFGIRWEFDPLAWQLLFMIGVSLGCGNSGRGLRVPRSPTIGAVACVYAAYALVAQREGWTFDSLTPVTPEWLAPFVLPVFERATLSPWRLAHVLSLSYLVAWVLPRDGWILRTGAARPLIVLGRHSLPLFTGGVLLSVLGWATIFSMGDGLVALALVNGGGVALMGLLAWSLERAPRLSR